MIGALQYVTMTRPAISFDVDQVSQFMHQPHFHAAKRIFPYLADTTSHGPMMEKQSRTELHAYTDVDWAECYDTRCSVSGCYINSDQNQTANRTQFDCEIDGIDDLVFTKGQNT